MTREEMMASMTEAERLLAGKMARITPDTDDSYRRLADGKWLLHGKVYPVAKPPLGNRREEER